MKEDVKYGEFFLSPVFCKLIRMYPFELLIICFLQKVYKPVYDPLSLGLLLKYRYYFL